MISHKQDRGGGKKRGLPDMMSASQKGEGVMEKWT